MNRLRIAIEDQFVVLKLNEQRALLPEDEVLDRFVQTILTFMPSYSLVCDLRKINKLELVNDLGEVTSDVSEVVNSLTEYGAYTIAEHEDIELIDYNFTKDLKIWQVQSKKLPLKFNEINLLPFSDLEYVPFDERSCLPEMAGPSLPTEDEYLFVSALNSTIKESFPTYKSFMDHWEMSLFPERYILESLGSTEIAGKRYLKSLFEKQGRTSLMTEFCFQIQKDEIIVTPYHSHSLHKIDANNQMIIGRPGVIAKKTNSLLRNELEEFEYLISKSKVKENEIQLFLEKHPNIIKSMGYSNIYPQLVLERDDGTSLRPDFIIEPIGQKWFDILEIKTPNANLVVGRRDRKTFSSAVNELIAQLREYSAYFESEKLCKKIEERFGIKCYKPKLTGIIGLNPSTQDERQLRRLMTAYTDIDILTFDHLLDIAKSRLLI